jgi:hypothetical protein
MAGISSCYEIACCDRNRRGGIKRIYLIDTDNVTGMTLETAGCTYGYKSIELVAATCFFKWEFDRGTAGFTANAVRENGSTMIDIELQWYVPKITCEGNEKLMQLVKSCGITAVVELYADDCGEPAENLIFVLGWDEIFEETAYMEFTSGEQATGIGLQDANGTLIKLTTQQGEYPRAYTSALSTLDVNDTCTTCA